MLAALLGLLLCAALPGVFAAQQDAAQKISPGDLRQAREAFDKGAKAESEGNWDAAFEYYSEAVARASANPDYMTARERARFQRVQAHVDRAERATALGRFDQAASDLRAALALDPGYSVAQQRLRQLETRAARTRVLPVTAEDVQLQPDAGVRSFNFTGNTRGAYEAVAGAFGLSAGFDSDLRVQPVRFKMDGVDFATAMTTLAQMTGTYWRPVDRKAFFVVENTAAKRREYAPSTVRSVLLPDTITPEEMTELLRVVREITGVERTTLNAQSRTLTLRDEPANVELAVELIRELQQPRGEMMLEVSILEVDRSEALRLGILPPSSARVFTISPADLDALQDAQSSPQQLAELLQRIFGTTGTGFGLGGLVPPLIAFGGGRTVALATLPGAAAEFAKSYGMLRRARRMLLRSSDGEPATFFLGERFPINFSVLSPGTGAGISPGGAPIPSQNEFAAGDAPSALLALDLNADTFTDLIVANRGDNTLSILLGNGDGTFQDATSVPNIDNPSALAAGDFNADGSLDLAITNESLNAVTILLGNGDGTFGAPSTFPTGAAPRAVIAMNTDLGGTLDLVVANHGDNNVSVLLGNGDGTFALPASFPTGLGPTALTTSDFDADTFADIAVANQNSDSVSILLGDGSGGFGTTTDFPTGAGPAAIVATNFDEGTPVDLATANEIGSTVTLLLGNGDGTFGSITDFSAGNAPVAIVAADLDGLGNIDLAVANRDDNSVSVLLGNGDGTLGLRADFTAGTAPVALVAANFNSDGRVDLATANRDDDTVTIILNSTVAGLGTFIPSQPYPGFQYEDIGLKVNATPRLHEKSEVTLHLRFEIRSLSGEALNGIPVISNRTIEQTVRLRENHTTVLAGMIQDEERRGMQGWPGLGRAPVIGHVTSLRTPEERQTELLILITPRRIRLAPRQDRQMYAGRDPVGSSRGAGAPPAPTEQPPPQPQPPTPPPPVPPPTPPPQRQDK